MNLNLIRVVNKAGAATCTAEDFQFFGRQITVTGFSLTENDEERGKPFKNYLYVVRYVLSVTTENSQ